jgi:hypothetical protein
MKNSLVCIATSLLLVVGVHFPASAEVTAEAARNLMQKSGFWTELESFPKQVKAGMAQSPYMPNLSPAVFAKMEAAADEAFSAEKMQAIALSVIQAGLSETQVKELMVWYDSPAGTKLTQIETASSASLVDLNTAVLEGNRALSGATSTKRGDLARLVKLTGSAELIVDMMSQVAVGVVEGFAAAAPDLDRLPIDQLRAQFAQQRPQMLVGATQLSVALAARTYEAVDEVELKRYVSLLASASGTRFSSLISQAMKRAFVQGAKEYGQGIGRAVAPVGVKS